jgi:tetratricopeptide (TPR) repeat protein
VARRRGDLTSAVNNLQRALEFHRTNAKPRLILLLTRDLARVAAEAGDRDLAERVYQELIALAVESADAPSEAQASLELAEVQLAGGYAYQARKHVERAIELDRWLENPLALAKVISRVAYEEHKFDLAVRTMQGALRQEGEAASAEDQALLELFRRAQAEGRYFPVP